MTLATSPLKPPISSPAPTSEEYGARNAVQISQHFEPFTEITAALFTVPAGKRLVIEHISVYVSVSKGTHFISFLTTKVGGVSGRHFLATRVQMIVNESVSDVHVGNHLIRAYADPGTDVGFNLHRPSSAGHESARITVSGYLVDMP